MAEIRIESKSVFGSDWHHLYLVYVDDFGDEYVIRGGHTNLSPWKIDTQAGIPLSISDDARKISDRDAHGSRIVDIGTRDAADVWKLMVRSAQVINLSSIDYDTYENNYDLLTLDFSDAQNSNSVVASVLRDVGINVNANLPTHPSGTSFPGVNNSLLDEYARQFLDEHTTDGDDLAIGGSLSDRFHGGKGNDSFHGNDGVDVASFAGSPSEYAIQRSLGGQITISHVGGPQDQGSDILYRVELAAFDNGDIIELNDPAQDANFYRPSDQTDTDHTDTDHTDFFTAYNINLKNFDIGNTYLEPVSEARTIEIEVTRDGSFLPYKILYLSTLPGTASASAGDYLGMINDSEYEVVFKENSKTASAFFTILPDDDFGEVVEQFSLMLRADKQNSSTNPLATTQVFISPNVSEQQVPEDNQPDLDEPTAPPTGDFAGDKNNGYRHDLPNGDNSPESPDYALTFANLSTSTLRFTSEFTIEVGYFNAGGDERGQSEIGFYLSTDERFGDSDDIFVGTDGLPPADGGESGDRSERLTLSESTMAREIENDNYYFFAVLDHEFDLSEYDWEDNVSQPIPVKVTGVPKPSTGEPKNELPREKEDLTVLRANLIASSIEMGAGLTVSFQIANIADGNAPNAGETGFWLSQDAIFGNADDQLVDTEIYGEISANSSGPEISNYVNGLSDLNAGTYWLFVEADTNNTRDEKDESNNASTGLRFTVGEQSTGGNGTNAPDNGTPTTLPIKFGSDDKDFLDGSGGSYVLVGGRGNDIYYLNDDSDQLIELEGGGRDQINTPLSLDMRLAAPFVEVLNVNGTDHANAIGNRLDNWIYGNEYNNEIRGDLGDDELGGRGGNDLILDAFGDEQIFGGSGNDKIADFRGTNVIEGNEGKDLLVGGTNSDNLSGGSGNDVLIGDISKVFSGADRLSGGEGDDLLFGGYGGDTFVFAPNSGNDVIAELEVDYESPENSQPIGQDFRYWTDKLELVGFGYASAEDARMHFNETSDGLQFSDQGTSILLYDFSANYLNSFEILVL